MAILLQQDFAQSNDEKGPRAKVRPQDIKSGTYYGQLQLRGSILVIKDNLNTESGYLAFGSAMSTIPTSPSTGTGIYIDYRGIYGILSGTPQFTIDATTGAITAISGTIGGWTITSTALSNAGGTVTLRGAGNLAFGATPPTSATVGTGIFINNAGVYGLASNVQQFYLQASDGKAYAGAGAVTLDSDGITISEGTNDVNSVTWQAAALKVGQIYSNVSSGNAILNLRSNPANDYATGTTDVIGGTSSGNATLRLVSNSSERRANFGVSSGVYIGTDLTASPSATLHVVGTALVTGALTAQGAFTSPGIDDNANAVAITIDSGELVGIGIASPQVALHVEKDADTQVKIRGTTRGRLRIGGPADVVTQLVVQDSPSNGDLQFLDNAFSATNMTVSNAGGVKINRGTLEVVDDVGIGTSSPSFLLDIRAASGFPSVAVGETGAAKYCNFMWDVTQEIAFLQTASRAYEVRVDASLFKVHTNNTLRMTIANGGTATFASDAVVATHLYVNDTADANVTTGLTINQGAADDKIFTLKSSDVAHGMTEHAETDTYFAIQKVDGASGGADLYGYKDADGNAGGAIRVRGYLGEAADTTKSTSALGVVSIDAAVENGADIQTLAANSNIVVFRNVTTTKFILDSDGDSHQDVGTAWTNFDTHDDLALLNLLSAHVTHKADPLRENFGTWLAQSRDELERLKLVTFNEDGHHFVNWSRMHMLEVGALRQMGARLERMEKLLGGGNDERTIRAAT
jgi:hypothetical protein